MDACRRMQSPGHWAEQAGSPSRRDGSGPARPDTFLRHLTDLAPNIVRTRLANMIEGFSSPAMTYEGYISVLERQSLPETAAALRELFAGD
jgi:hypothetical protein